MATKQINLQVNTKGAKKAEKEFGRLGGAISKVGGILAAVSVGAIAKGGFELSKMSAEAEGVRVAFGRLNRPDLLGDLREATKGTVSDIELMRRAVSANNFRISLEQLPTLLKFAQQRARETGESVDYLVNSIVTGIGRKSPLILDNLGLSAIEVREEFKKTGDMAEAVGNIIDREFEKSGELGETTADAYDRAAASLENFALQQGDVINTILKQTGALTQQSGIVEGLGDLWNAFIDKILPFARVAAQAEAYKQLNKQVKEHEEAVKKQLTAYEEWRQKTLEKRDADQQELMWQQALTEELARKNGFIAQQIDASNIGIQQSKEQVEQIEKVIEVSSGAAEEFEDMADTIIMRNQAWMNSFAGTLSFALQQSRVTFRSIGQAFERMLVQMAIDFAARAAIFAIFNALLPGGGGNAASFIFGGLGGRADGGPVRKNKPYIVGEQGPELFVPHQSGDIIPNGQMGNITVNLNGPVMGNAKDIARQLAPELMKLQRQRMN